MPITQERETIQELRAVGFSEQQAIVLAAKLEAASQATSQDLKGFISRELAALEERLERRFLGMDLKIAELRTELHASLRAQTLKLMAILIAALSLAVAIIKLFPNVP